jgi:hypothetical protein
VAIAVRLAGGGCGDFDWCVAGDVDRFGDGEVAGELVEGDGDRDFGDLVGVSKVGAVGAVAPATAAEEVPGGLPLIQTNSSTTMITTATAASGASS